MTNLEQIEGLLFVAGDEGITIPELEQATGFMRPAIHLMLEKLAEKYQADAQSALCLLVTDGSYRLATKRELAPVIKRYFEAPLATNLSQASLEVLAITAYRQPVTRIDIDEIRGVSSAATVQKLVLRNLIVAHGRKDEPGRPILYETTPMFLDYFGLTSLTDLPPLPETETLAEAQPETSDLFLAAFTSQLTGTDAQTETTQGDNE
ncbi:SMC-Scp complex subunit ScpB [Furfurilactobacillus siliginis]|uniref:Segregation and condensation protein B n=1 Tax=Furfurilactobacillus siliginis TaxID=348151 RepID=A0A0R2L607_9LACO|nr:SMC-Scp complex subunit ScpB [Furfurilactobacillus siliginis]KRN97026.1 transcription regulator [Furfurilactobacillus siliginis]GEK27786.1 segregation and condensation protein B [Furfurilactobacillus siliginis]